MDLTDEQWSIIQPLIPDPPRRPDGKGRPWRDSREVMTAYYGYYVQEHHGMTCQTDTRHTRHATVGFSSGYAPARLRRYFRHWLTIYTNVVA